MRIECAREGKTTAPGKRAAKSPGKLPGRRKKSGETELPPGKEQKSGRSGTAPGKEKKQGKTKKHPEQSEKEYCNPQKNMLK